MNLRHAMGLGVLVVSGCSATAGTDAFSDEKVATSSAALDVGTSSLELDGLASADPGQAAAQVVASRTDGCRTRTVDPSNPDVVHVVLDACTGRFGRHVVSGQLTVTFSANPDGSLHAETVSNSLTIDGLAFTRHVSADIRVTASTRYVTRHAEETGTTANGDSLARTGDHMVVIDEATHCRTVNGTGQTVIAGARTIDSTIADFQTCETAAGAEFCPTGSISHVNEAKGRTVAATFDGSATATIDITKPKGDRTTTWSLDCTAH